MSGSWRRLAGLLMLLMLTAAACGGDDGGGGGGDGGTAAPTTIRFQASWIPDCQFAGYLMANEQGFFADENLEVEILPGGPNVNPIQQVVSGAADITVNKVVALYAARDQGLPVKAIAQFDRVSSFPLVARKDSGIATPEDMRGKDVGIWYDGDEYEVLALLEQAGLDPQTDLNLFEQGFTMDPFLAGEYDVAMVTSYNELNVLRLEGLNPDTELNVIDPSAYGISIPHGSVIANEAWLEENRDAAVGFVRATITGWEYAFANPEETASVCAEESLAAGGEAATEDLQALQELQLPELERLQMEGSSAEQRGWIDPALYQEVVDIVTRFGLLENEADVEGAYDPTIWEEATS